MHCVVNCDCQCDISMSVSSLVPSPFLYPRERVWGTVHIRHVPVECMMYARC